MRYDHLGIVITKRCNAACEICCFESSPQCNDIIDYANIEKLIISTKDNNQLTTISFTGGEPFLEYDLLKKLIFLSKSIGKKVTCITNGFWAISYSVAIQKLEELKELGLTTISISFDSYHRKYINENNIINLLKACKVVRIPVNLGIAHQKDESVGYIIDILGDSIEYSNIQIFPCLPVGRAKHDILFSRNIKNEGLKCNYNGNLIITTDQKVYPCCSQCIFESELYIKDYTRFDYNQIKVKLKNNGILYILRNYGFDFFCNIAKEKLNIDIPEYVTSPCELCPLLFSEANINKFFPYVQNEIKKLTSNDSLQI